MPQDFRAGEKEKGREEENGSKEGEGVVLGSAPVPHSSHRTSTAAPRCLARSICCGFSIRRAAPRWRYGGCAAEFTRCARRREPAHRSHSGQLQRSGDCQPTARAADGWGSDAAHRLGPGIALDDILLRRTFSNPATRLVSACLPARHPAHRSAGVPANESTPPPTFTGTSLGT